MLVSVYHSETPSLRKAVGCVQSRCTCLETCGAHLTDGVSSYLLVSSQRAPARPTGSKIHRASWAFVLHQKKAHDRPRHTEPPWACCGDPSALLATFTGWWCGACMGSPWTPSCQWFQAEVVCEGTEMKDKCSRCPHSRMGAFPSPSPATPLTEEN